MTTRMDDNGNNGAGLLIGLAIGGAIGAGLALAFAPRTGRQLRQRLTSAASDFGDAASRRYEEVGSRIASAVDEVAARGQAARDEVADAVGRGAREVEQFARASKTSPGSRRS